MYLVLEFQRRSEDKRVSLANVQRYEYNRIDVRLDRKYELIRITKEHDKFRRETDAK
jgi:hypothetical protein